MCELGQRLCCIGKIAPSSQVFQALRRMKGRGIMEIRERAFQPMRGVL